MKRRRTSSGDAPATAPSPNPENSLEQRGKLLARSPDLLQFVEQKCISWSEKRLDAENLLSRINIFSGNLYIWRESTIESVGHGSAKPEIFGCGASSSDDT
ncbi:hypothetical protein PVK06_026251 [Gossypium arboreum]|uniref:Uncharacterized protein n=1 Tax=Gossypium arboreum TaxID=29729 RepID=A0ABR0NX94_GOSAR|nr:hypothetical protein PVK06_026251 [Gossypium arboreum]